MVKVTCKFCGKEFETHPQRVQDGRGKYCSKDCCDKDKIKIVTVSCQYCGKAHQVKPCIAKKQKYCSRKCQAEAFKTGETKQCPACRNMFYTTDPQRKYCSANCWHSVWKISIAPKMTNRTRKRIQRICQTCGKEFEIIPSWVSETTGKYCSRDCKHIAQTKVVGVNHPLHKEPAHKICEFCGKAYTTKPAIKDRSRFCSMQCHGAWQSRNIHSPTSIEITVANILNSMHLKFNEQISIGKYLCDFLIPEYKLVIEADGTYWHGTPAQKEKDWRKDCFLKESGYEVLRLPEKLITESPDTCKVMITAQLMR